MPFIYSVAAHVSDSKLFAEAGAGWAGERMRSLGANSVTANQVVMGGEMAGQVLVAFEVDTADSAMALNAAIYGDGRCESVLGEWLQKRRIPREKVVIITKGGCHGQEKLWSANLDPGHLRRSLRSSLDRLRITFIDVFLLHR